MPDTIIEHKEGDRVDLCDGWFFELWARDNGSLQGFVFSPDGKHSASMAFADACGTVTGSCFCDDVVIPHNVQREIQKYAEQYS